MPTQSKLAQPLKLTSIQATGANSQFLSEPRQQLTKTGQQSPSYRQHAENIATSTPSTKPQLKNMQSEKGNDPQLLAAVFKATVEAMHEKKMLAIAKTTSGKLLIILPTDLFNDDLTLKDAK